jgi:hypothetical protein
MKEVERLRAYSNKNNFGSATNDKSNALYTSSGGQIDTGFLKAKTLKHAFKAYPKVPTGKFTTLEPALEEEVLPSEVDYGFDVDNQDIDNTQDVDHEEVKPDEFSQALQEHSQSEPEPTKQFAGMEDDEPEF